MKQSNMIQIQQYGIKPNLTFLLQPNLMFRMKKILLGGVPWQKKPFCFLDHLGSVLNLTPYSYPSLLILQISLYLTVSDVKTQKCDFGNEDALE